MNTSITDQFRQVIIANELEGNLDYVTKFSDPDGVRSGKSGWSFGVCQFDTQNNNLATQCLLECEFTSAEIVGIRHQTIDVKPLEAKLKEHAMIIAKWDERQLTGCLQRADRLMDKHGIHLADDAALLAVADYDNQYSLSDINKPGFLINYLASLGRPVTAKDVLVFKLGATKYGREHPGDCRRRYDNLIKIVDSKK